MLDQAVSMSKKSPDAFRTISEVSVELDVPQHVLRFWETRFAQVRPVKRGGGRRYYRPEDVDVLRGIRSLLYSEGFTIKGVQKIFRDHGVRYVAEIGRGEASIGPADIPETLPEPLPSPSRPSAEIVSFQPRVIVSTTPELSEDNRVKLEILLAALLQMKGRIRAAMSALTV